MSEHSIHTEGAFENAIVTHLAENGWHQGKASDFSRDLAFDKKAVLNNHIAYLKNWTCEVC